MKKKYPPALHAVLFDMDGVLVDSLEAWRFTVNQTLKALGYPLIGPAQFKKDFGQGTEADSVRYTQGKVAPEDLEKSYSELFSKNLFRIKPNPRAGFVLTRLKIAGVRTACVTNSNRHLTKEVLKNCGLYSLLDNISTGSDVSHHKPHPAMVLKALNDLKVNAKNAVMVGDSIFDQKAAKAAKVFFTAFKRSLKGSDASVKELDDLLKKLPKKDS